MTKAWTTREGQKIPIDQLDDSHLLNCIKMIKRKHEETMNAGWQMIGTVSSDEAYDDVERELNALEDGPHTISKSYTDLVAEARRRGYNV
jgi:hypothetical protein